MGPINPARNARGLLDWFGDDRSVVDRATLLPIGQYDDGSLTFAWPGFLKDAYEGAVRSFEQGRQLPRVDDQGFYAGTPRAEPLDAFNAASIAPVAGVGMRAAGLAGEPAVAKARPARPLYDLMPDTASQNEFSYRIFRDGRDAGMEARGTINGPEAFIDWIGPKMRNGDDAESILSDLATARGSQDNINSLGVSGLRALREALRRDFPDVKVFSGERISGANPDRWQSVPIAANPENAALPYLMSPGSEPGGLLAPEPQPEMSLLFASADPQQDANWLMQYMRPPEPAAPWIDTPAIEQQNWQDPPLWRFQLPEPPKQRLLPLRDQW